MDDENIFPDLLPSDKAPIRVRKTKRTVKERTENVHILDNRRVQKKDVSKGALRMRKYRSKPGIREKEKKKNGYLKKEFT